MRRTAAETREHVLRVARDLFYWEGIRATGVDRVAAAAGVAPTTLYRLFASKDDLVAAYVDREGRRYREWFAAALEAGGSDPRARVLALFDALAEQVQPDRCRGCPFQMALAEVPEPDLAAHRGAVDTKAWVRSTLEAVTADLAGSAAGSDPAELADQLAVIIEGVYASVASLGAEGPARRARALAERLLGS